MTDRSIFPFFRKVVACEVSLFRIHTHICFSSLPYPFSSVARHGSKQRRISSCTRSDRIQWIGWIGKTLQEIMAFHLSKPWVSCIHVHFPFKTSSVTEEWGEFARKIKKVSPLDQSSLVRKVPSCSFKVYRANIPFK